MSVAKGFRLSDDSTAKLDWNYVTKPDGTKSIIEEVNDVKEDLANIPTGASVPANVRQAISDLLSNSAFASTDANTLSNLAILASWADTTVTAITLNHSTLTFNSATTQQLTATLTPSDATDTVTWTSSNTSVATVSNSGLVTAVGNGSATITASVGSVSAQCSVSVSGVLSTFTITNNLTHVTNSNNATVATENSSYTATLTAESGYTLGNVTITMGETDITSTAYDNGSISIASVTGNIVITASIQASNMDGWTDGIAYTDLTVVKNEYCEKATGNFKSYSGWDRTGYVPCNGATSITFPAASSMSAITSDSNWFFTENHTGIQYFGLAKAGKTVTVPSNAYYFVISETSACVEQLIQAGVVPNA